MSKPVPVTRADVERWWVDLLEGTCTRDQASQWAEYWLNQDPGDIEELVIQGLLTLQSFINSDLSHDELMAEVAGDLTRWRNELQRYDADPDAWMCEYFTTMLSSFAGRHGVDSARAFGAKMVRDGWLTERDVEAALPLPRG